MNARTWYRLHSMTGVMAGLILFVICWTGTTAILADEIDWAVNPAMRLSEGVTSVHWGRVYDSVSQVAEPANIDSLHAPLNGYAAVRVQIKPQDQPDYWVYVHPRSGRILGAFSEFTVQEFLRDLHRHLFLPKPTGIVVVALFAIPLAGNALAALMFYRRWWRRFFRFRLFTRHGCLAWSDIHKTAGLWGLGFIALVALTGLWYGVEATGVPDRLFARNEHVATAVPHVPASQRLGLERLVDQAKSLRPDLAIRQVEPHAESQALHRVRVSGRGPDWFLRDRVNYALVAADGRPVATRRGTDLSAYQYWVHMADPLHFGSFAGLASQLIWLVFGLMLCGLVLSGTWLYANRIERQAGAARGGHWTGTLPAYLASIILIVVAAVFGVQEVISHAAGATTGPLSPEIPIGVTIFIGIWLVITLVIIGCWPALLWRSGYWRAS